MNYKQPQEFKLVSLRECPVPSAIGDCPDRIYDYWVSNVPGNPYFNSAVENVVLFMLNARRRLIGHVHISTGLLDQVLLHPREIFRPAIVANSSAIVLAHNHPSGDPTPSEADVKITREIISAGQLLRIELLDHLVIGAKSSEFTKPYRSLRELGYFYA